jgi:MFS superfamily sulfate permease-like transporter
MAAIWHGVFLLLSVAFFTSFLNMLPLASLAAILLVVGYKLARPSIFMQKWKEGFDQFAPFIITVVAILLTDLLIGIIVGLLVGFIFIVRTNFHSPISIIKNKNQVLLRFNKDVSFLNKATVTGVLEQIAPNSHLVIDGTNANFIDHDVMEAIYEFRDSAGRKKIEVKLKNLPEDGGILQNDDPK